MNIALATPSSYHVSPNYTSLHHPSYPRATGPTPLLAPCTAPRQIFNASHMAGFDVPHVSHDMILRFMGVNFTALTDGSVRIPSAVGADSKPLPAVLDEQPSQGSGKTPEQDKARWEGTS